MSIYRKSGSDETESKQSRMPAASSASNYSEEEVRAISQLAMNRAQLLLSCYRSEEAADAKTMIAAMALVLSQYEDRVIMRVTDPLKGIASTSRFLPSIAEVTEACEEQRKISAPSDYGTARSERANAQLAERRRFEEQYPEARKMREFYESGRISDYLRDGGPLPAPGQHIGRGK